MLAESTTGPAMLWYALQDFLHGQCMSEAWNVLGAGASGSNYGSLLAARPPHARSEKSSGSCRDWIASREPVPGVTILPKQFLYPYSWLDGKADPVLRSACEGFGNTANSPHSAISSAVKPLGPAQELTDDAHSGADPHAECKRLLSQKYPPGVYQRDAHAITYWTHSWAG